MRRFVNSIWLLVLMWSGPLVFVIAWSFLFRTAGFINSLVFIGLMGTSSHFTKSGPRWAAGFVSRRITIRKAENDALEGRVIF